MDNIRYDDIVRQGSRWEFKFWLSAEGGEVLSMTGWSAKGQLRVSPNDAALEELHFSLHDYTDPESSEVTNDGLWKVWLDAQETDALPVRKIAYTVELTPPSGSLYTVVYLEGVLTVKPGMTV